MHDSDKKSDATVLRPSRTTPPIELTPPNSQSDATIIKKSGPSLDTEQAQALTRINKSLQTSDSSTGFEKAREVANRALSSHKMILNNRFVLDTIIGGGGMGTVYKARDLRKVEANDANPFVAVKVLNEDFQQHPDAFVTLQREASRSQNLAHPNIITVHDFDRDGSVIYMTMQLLEGTDLEKHIKASMGKGLATDEALGIINDYCAALIYAHDKHIVHSDFKPGNIFLTEAGAKVLDFGIARLSAGIPSQDSFDAGSLGALTPAYASLEMLNGEPPDPSDDVYAAAIIAYELLSGKHPYQRKSAQEALQEGLKPARIEKLNHRQWRALDAALKLRRIERSATVSEFLNQLTGSRKPTILKIAALGLVIISALLAYFQFLAPNEVTTVVSDTLNKGRQCFTDKDFTCAIESATAVLKLEPENKTAKELYRISTDASQEAQLDRSYQSALSCIIAGNLDCARAEMMTLQRLAPASPKIADVQTKLQIKIASDKAERCMEEQRYSCVIQNTGVVLGFEPNNAAAMSLANQAKQLQAEQQQQDAANLQHYTQYMASSNKCFSDGNYECSINSAKQALRYKPSDIDAETMVQKASFAQMQQQQALAKARTVLAQGDNCFKRKDYSCAIAKSESALEFVPDFKEAIMLKQQAQQEIARLKQSITIK